LIGGLKKFTAMKDCPVNFVSRLTREETIRHLFLNQGQLALAFAACYESFPDLESICCLGPPPSWQLYCHFPRYPLLQWMAQCIQLKIGNSSFTPTQNF
jgi:hypothetical protein